MIYEIIKTQTRLIRLKDIQDCEIAFNPVNPIILVILFLVFALILFIPQSCKSCQVLWNFAHPCILLQTPPMPKQVYITIDTPCHEDWNAMTHTAQGAYCSSCNKQVIDFTRKTENEIYDIVTQSGHNLCGRFTQFQLEQPVRKTEIKNGLLNWRAIAASMAALASVADVKEVKAQSECSITSVRYQLTTELVVADQRIKGLVIAAETKEPLEGAVVKLRQAGLYALTNAKGIFCFEVNIDAYKSDVVDVSYLACKTKSESVANICPTITPLFELKPLDREEIMMIGGISVRHHRTCKKKKQ